MADQFYINAEHLTKEYIEKQSSHVLPRAFRKTGQKSFRALDDLSFSISNGERVGIIGPNGAGKTTLLNMITGFSQPTGGALSVSGGVNAIMDIGTSVEDEMTGRENIFLGGELYGKTKAEIEALIPEMLDFIELGDYIDMPVKTYSSGMKAKLAFSLIAFVNPEILVIDEVLGVGDATFSQKSSQKMFELCERGKILLLVSHSMDTIRQFADRCLWLDHGRLVMDGGAEEVTRAYTESVLKMDEERMRHNLEVRMAKKDDNGSLRVEELSLWGENGEERLIFPVLGDIRIRIRLAANTRTPDTDVALSVMNMNGDVMWHNRFSKDMGAPFSIPAGGMALETVIERCPLVDSNYEVLCEVFAGGEKKTERIAVFKVADDNKQYLNKPEFYCDYTAEVRMGR